MLKICYDQHFSTLIELLQEATRQIRPEYFLVPIAGRQDTIHRERVYCYELYHRLRQLMTSRFINGPNYVLNGELAKVSHPIMQTRRSPDLLVHEPGNMDHNLAVIEVKSIKADKRGRNKDVETIAFFVNNGHYYRGVYLIYGELNGHTIGKFRSSLQALEPDQAVLLWHKKPGTKATLASR